MKIVQLSEQDRAIIRAIIESTAIGKATISDLKNIMKAEDAIRMDVVPRGDIRDFNDNPDTWEVEDAQYDALKAAVEGDGKMNLSKLVMRQYVACVEHIEVAKETPKE
jgi:hypothetical protein